MFHYFDEGPGELFESIAHVREPMFLGSTVGSWDGVLKVLVLLVQFPICWGTKRKPSGLHG